MIQLRVVPADHHPQVLTLLRSLLEPEYRVERLRMDAPWSPPCRLYNLILS